MLINSLAIIFGFILLIWSADRFILGASATARNLNVSPLVIGLTIVGFGTSAPEMLVSTFAALNGSPQMAIGNALGSNIANITLVLGVAALIATLKVDSGLLRKELPLLLMATVLALVLLMDKVLSRSDGIILFGSVIIMLWWITRQALVNRNSDPLQVEYARELPAKMTMLSAVSLLIVGLLLLLLSSKLLVWGAVNIATELGISELVIGLTIIAVGTSLPELAASIAGVLKNEHDIVVGNVIGSNLFNTLAVLGIPGILAPGSLAEGVMERDIPIVFILTIALFIMAYGFRGPGRINRIEGLLLVQAFIGYQALLYFTVIRNSL